MSSDTSHWGLLRFGDQVGGVLCYAIKSRARRECPTIDTEKTARALCKIQIQNKSTEQLHCKKFCLRLDHCHLWQAGVGLWTSPVHIRFNGSDHLSAIDYSPKPPAEAKDATKIADANPNSLNEPEPLVLFQDFGASSLDFLLGVWFEKSKFLDLKNSIMREIKERFDQEGIEIAFPHLTVYAGSETPPFPVKVEGSENLKPE